MADPTDADPIDFVSAFLRLLEARDLDAAGRYLAPGVTITFPGGRRFTTLEEQVASSAGRFQKVGKTFDRFDVVTTDDRTIVYVFGTLAGVAIDGTPFAGVRYLDRFELSDDGIVDQKVWNDLAESGVLGAR